MPQAHPLVQTFIREPQRVLELAEQLRQTQDPLAQALINGHQLQLVGKDQPFDDFKRHLADLHDLGLDGNGLMLVIWFAMTRLLAVQEDVGSIGSLVATGRSLVDHTAHPLIAALPEIMGARLQKVEFKPERIKDLEYLADPQVTHHDVCLLAWKGLAGPLIGIAEDITIAYGVAAETFWDRTRLINALEACRSAEVASMLEDLAEFDDDIGLTETELLYVTFMAWFSNALTSHRHLTKDTLDQLNFDWQRLGGYRPGLETFLSLHLDDEAELTELQRRTTDHAFTTSSLFGFTCIRAALATRNLELARDQLFQRRHRGCDHYLDDLFWARIYLAEGDGRRAAQCFERALSLAYHFGAEGRVQFELSLSRELTPLDIFELGRIAGEGHEEGPASPHVLVESGEPRATSVQSDQLVGSSPSMQRVRQFIEVYAATDSPVLITGETGTGKELAARDLHRLSPRSEQPFVAINCAGISDSLLEAELFGHRKGAFTGADVSREGLVSMAGEGTLFLDEIGDASPRFQASLLRLLETGDYRPVGQTDSLQIRCRIIAATNVLSPEWLDGRGGRRDLFYRLSRLHIHLPPLHDRRDDIPELAQHFLRRLHPRGSEVAVDGPLLQYLQDEPWPGNVRELRNAIENLYLHFPTRLRFGLVEWRSATSSIMAPETKAVARTTSIRNRRSSPDQEAERPASEESSSNVVPTTAIDDGERPATRGFEASDSDPAAVPAALEPAESSTVPAAEVSPPSPPLGNKRMRRQQELRQLFRRHGQLTRKDVIRLLDISHVTAARDLQRLVADGFIERIEPTASPSTHYFQLLVS